MVSIKTKVDSKTSIDAYDISITHIPGKNNTISDALSRSRTPNYLEPETPYMTQKEAEILMNALKLPNSTKMSIREVKLILQGTGLPSLIKSQLNKGKTKNAQKIPLSSLQPTKKTAKENKTCLYNPKLHPI